MNMTYPTALVLQALARGYHYGFDIMDATGLPSGTVYPILRRLDREGLIKSKWEAAAAAHREARPARRYYEITAAGEAVNEAEAGVERHDALQVEAVGGQGAGLVGADDVDGGHGLDGVEALHDGAAAANT